MSGIDDINPIQRFQQGAFVVPMSWRLENCRLNWYEHEYGRGSRVKSFDTINKAQHYNSHPSGIECIDIVEHHNFNVGNAIKYLWRCENKGAHLDDLKKARYYCDREIKRLEREQHKSANADNR